MHTRFWWRHLRERDHLEDPGVDWRIILRSVFTKMDWIKLAQYRDRWRVLVNEVLSPRVPYNPGNFLTS